MSHVPREQFHCYQQRHQEQVSTATSQYVHPVNARRSDATSDNWTMNASDLYRASDRRRYFAATGVQPTSLKSNTGVSQNDATLSAARVIPIDFSDYARVRSSTVLTGRRSATLGDLFSATAAGGNLTNAANKTNNSNNARITSSKKEPKMYVTTVEHRVNDYARQIAHKTIKQTSSGIERPASAANDQVTSNVVETYRMKLTSLLANPPSRVKPKEIVRETTSETIKQRQYKLLNSTRSSTVTQEDTRSLLSSKLSAHLRRSMPNVNMQSSESETVAVYPYSVLQTSNYRFPPDVDRCRLERHLSTEEFVQVFQMSRMDYYRLPDWRRNELKKRVLLF